MSQLRKAKFLKCGYGLCGDAITALLKAWDEFCLEDIDEAQRRQASEAYGRGRNVGRESMRREAIAIIKSAIVADPSLDKIVRALEELE